LFGETATHIFRVAQELATNAAKHAHPSWIEINFEAAGRQARLVISHDGQPYRPDVEAEHSGMGMHMVRQRLPGGIFCFRGVSHPPATDVRHNKPRLK
jgi:signal transduction histidine kinase